MRDMFGNEISVAEARALLASTKKGRKPTQPKGYAALPGSGPEGETCRSCKHIARIEYAKTYLKCELMRSHWTGGPGTDIRAKSPACSRWEARA